MSKAKGSRTERELLHMFWEAGHFCLRVAGSGSMPFPCPDLLVGKGGRSFAIECKSCKSDKRYITEQQINELKEFAQGFGAEPWIAMRFDRTGWKFLKPEELGRNGGKNFFVSKDLCKEKGITFQELIDSEDASASA